MRYVWSWLFVLYLLSVIAVGCRPIEHLVTSQDPYRTAGYHKAFEKWTKEARIYRGLDVELIVSATFKSVPYRRAYAKEYAGTYLLSGEDELRLERDQTGAGGKFHDFVMAAFIPDDKWNDFEQKDSMWRITLSNDIKNRIEPLEIRKLDRKDPQIKQFFPYMTAWRQVYLLRFPVEIPEKNEQFIGPDTRVITLTVTSVRGKCDMTWEVNN